MGRDKLYFRRSYAQAKVKLITKTSVDGKSLTTSTLNSEKISDTTRAFLQNNAEAEEFRYDRLASLAIKDLEKDFNRLGWNDPKNKTEKVAFDKKKNIAISNWQENYIREKFPNILKIDLDTFIKATKIKTAQYGIQKALRILSEAQNSNYYDVEHKHVNLDTGEVSVGISQVQALPAITLWLDESLADKGYTLSSFAEAKIKNKRKLIKGLQIEFSPMYLFHVLSIGTDYVTSLKSQRDNFIHGFSHKLDILINSLYKIRNNVNALTFDIQSLKEQLVGDKPDLEYKYFKRDTLNKAVKDINKNTGKNIKIKEKKEGRKVVAVTFYIENKEMSEFFTFLCHYVSSQLYFFSKTEIKSIPYFESYLQAKDIKDDEVIGESKTFLEWEEEAESAFEAEKDILSMLETDELFFERNSIIYDKTKHTILNKNVFLEDGEEKTAFTMIYDSNIPITTPQHSLRYIHNITLEKMRNSIHIADLIPFGYFNRLSESWVKIDSIDTLSRYKENIYKDIVLKSYSKFTFEEDTHFDMFKYYCEKNMFEEINENVKKKIKSLFEF